MQFLRQRQTSSIALPPLSSSEFVLATRQVGFFSPTQQGQSAAMQTPWLPPHDRARASIHNEGVERNEAMRLSKR